jgi:hypothetical protein
MDYYIRQHPKKAARKTTESIEVESDDSEKEIVEISSDEINVLSDSDGPESSDVELIENPPDKREGAAPPLRSPSRQPSHPPPQQVAPRPLRLPSPVPEDLIRSLGVLSLSGLSQVSNPPFLGRNVRKGFLFRCQQRRVNTQVRDNDVHLRIVTKKIDSASTHVVDVDAWCCNLCAVHGQFRNIDMLKKHMEWDHSDVGVAWKHQRRATVRI